MKIYFELLRPKQWVKNFFVFGAIIFARKFLVLDDLWKTLAAFGLFCAVSSSIYIINDIFDRKEDALHPEKKDRPIASGRVSVGAGWVWAGGLGLLGLLGAFGINQYLGVVVLAYFVLNFCYSVVLKHIVILDVIVVALGFVLRVAAGAAAILVPVSPWIIITTLLLALFMALAKRRHELGLLEGSSSKHRRILAEYNPAFLDQMIGVVTTSTLITYALYTMSAETIKHTGTDKLILTVPIVLYGIFRYQYLVYKKEQGGNPTKMMLTDRPLIVAVLLWVIVSGIIIYYKP